MLPLIKQNPFWHSFVLKLKSPSDVIKDCLVFHHDMVELSTCHFEELRLWYFCEARLQPFSHCIFIPLEYNPGESPGLFYPLGNAPVHFHTMSQSPGYSSRAHRLWTGLNRSECKKAGRYSPGQPQGVVQKVVAGVLIMFVIIISFFELATIN